MAYYDRDHDLLLWLPASPYDLPADGYFPFEGEAAGFPAEAGEPSYGFIVCHWFGPFLLSPPTRHLRGRC
jgi:hypothetical protein